MAVESAGIASLSTVSTESIAVLLSEIVALRIDRPSTCRVRFRSACYKRSRFDMRHLIRKASLTIGSPSRCSSGEQRYERHSAVDPRIAVDTRVAKALSHPVRVKALEILNEGVASPSDIARRLEMPVANVSYHVTTLLRLKCIEEVETRHVRGAIEHLYRATRRPSAGLDEYEAMPVNARHAWVSHIANVAFNDLRDALNSDAFGERADQHFSWTRLALDQEGWSKVYRMLDDVIEKALEEQAAAAARMKDADGSPEIRSMLSIFHYESPPRAAS